MTALAAERSQDRAAAGVGAGAERQPRMTAGRG